MNLLEIISESSDELFQVNGIQDFEDLVQILQDPLQESSAWGIDIYVRVLEHLLHAIYNLFI